jgi:uncharacterized protein YjbI with pentapeptide repeats
MLENKRWKSTNKERRVERLVIVGLIVALVVSVSGVALAGNSPPSSINTCTSVNHHGVYGKTKVTTGASCRGTQFFQTWNNGSAAQQQIASLSKYKQLLLDSWNGSATTSYAGVDFSNMDLPVSGTRGGTFDFSSATFTNSELTDGQVSGGCGCVWTHSNFSGANFNAARLLYGAFGSDNFHVADFTGADLFGADFTGSLMTGVTYSNTTCPNGMNSNNVGFTCAGQGGGL